LRVIFYLLISRTVFFDHNDKIRSEIPDFLKTIQNKEIQVVIVTRSSARYKKIVDEELSEYGIKFGNRGKLSRKVFDGIYSNVMLIGAVDEDIRIAANNKILLINPLWITNIETNIEKYGFQLQHFNQIIQCIDILKLNCELFYDLRIDGKTRLIAVSNANKYYAVENEQEMISKYMRTLKYGNRDYRYAVYFHYLTMIYGMEEFSDVDLWMAVPSSTGSNNNNIYDIVKRTRYLLNNRKSQDVFIRHRPAQKSTYMDSYDRIRQGCKRHLDTIHLNPYYKGKLKGKKICILDDYTTYGPSFESVRNLLLKEGVSEIILVAIGTFQKEYYKEEYEITGDVFGPGYTYKLKEKIRIVGESNELATEMINNIYKIINS
jgi:predicted amidophosphoribosyltransferase